MTIASEICRLQTDKEAMRQAIIGKGVDVASSVSFDDYACCIAAIPTPLSYDPFIDLLVVGGGGDGGRSNAYTGGGGGGGGGVIVCEALPLNKECSSYNVCAGCKGQNSCFNDVIACRGGNGGSDPYSCGQGYNGGSGGGSVRPDRAPGNGISGQGNNGGKGSGDRNSSYAGGGGGGGGAGSAGCNTSALNGGNGGDAIINCFSGEAVYYGGGGGGGVGVNGSLQYGTIGTAGCGGGNGGGCKAVGCNATGYGGGGGGGGGYTAYCRNGGNGYQGVVILRYKADGTCGIKPSSTGGCKYLCGERVVHCFCNAGALETFNPIYN